MSLVDISLIQTCFTDNNNVELCKVVYKTSGGHVFNAKGMQLAWVLNDFF